MWWTQDCAVTHMTKPQQMRHSCPGTVPPKAPLGQSGGLHTRVQRSWTARPYTPVVIPVRLRAAAPSPLDVPPAGKPSVKPPSGMSALLAGMGEKSDWRPSSARAYSRPTGGEKRIYAPAPPATIMLGDFNDRRLETATSIRDNYTNHMANPNFVPREIRKPGASNTSSDPEHELFMRRKDRVTAALSETAEFFRPMPPSAYNSPRGPKPAWDPSLHSTRGILVGQEGANAALLDSKHTTTAMHYPRFEPSAYLTRPPSAKYPDTPRITEHDVEDAPLHVPVENKGIEQMARFLPSEVGTARRVFGTTSSPRNACATESAQRYAWPQVTEATRPVRPKPGLAYHDLIV